VQYKRVAERVRLVAAVLLSVIVGLGSATQADAARRHHHRSTAAKVQRSGDDDIGSSARYAAHVVDDKTGRVLFSKNADAPRHPASLTKMMTLFILFEELKRGRMSMDSRLTVSRRAAEQAPSKLGFRPGQTIAVEDAIRALVTKSANDVAVAIAENIGGSEDDFARRMTATAKRIGMRGSVFYNASGLPNSRQFTTARDMVTLGRALQERFPAYYRYFSTRSFAWGGGAIPNHNRLLYRLDGIDGIKTGYTDASGFNLVSSLRRDNRHLVAAVLGGSSARARDDHMIKLLTSHIGEASTSGKVSSVFTENRVAEADVGDDAAPSGALAYAAEVPAPVAAPRETIAVATTPATTDGPVDLVHATAAATPRSANANAPRIASSEQISLPRTETETRVSSDRGAAVAMARAILLPVPANGRQPAAEVPRPVSRAAAQPEPARSAVPADLPKVFNSEPIRVRTASITPPPPVSRPMTDASEATGSLGAKRKVEDAAPKSELRGWLIQIGAYDKEAAAKAALAKAKDRLSRSVGRLEGVTEATGEGGGRLWRARFAGLKDQKAAEAACKELRRKDFACLALRQ
jgi:D-alanyl-D-alanine carboxypeptidase